MPAAELLERRRSARSEGLRLDAQEEESPPLEEERARRYASVSARGNYLALDRPDLMYATKELMRHLSKPSEEDDRRLKRVGRYVLGSRRLVCMYPWKRLTDTLVVHVDSNHAACPKTRLSTAGGTIAWGSQFLKAWSKTVGNRSSPPW